MTAQSHHQTSSSDTDYLKKYLVYLKRYPIGLIVGLICIPCITLVHIAQPLIIKTAIDDMIIPNQLHQLPLLATALLLAVVGEFSLRAIQTYLFQTIGQLTVTDIRHDLFKHVTSFKMSYLDRTPQGILTSRLTSDLESLNDSFATGIVTLIADVLTIIGILIVMISLSIELTIVTMVTIPPLAIFVNICRKKLRLYYNRIRATIGKLNASIQEQLDGLSIIQQYNRQALNQRQFDTLNTTYRQSTISSVVFDAMLFSVIESMTSIVVGIIIAYALGIRDGELITIGLLVAFIDYIQKLFQPLKELSNKFAILQHALASLEKIFGLFNVNETMQHKSPTLTTLNGPIVFKSVSFVYPSHPDKPVITNVSLTIEPKQTIAIVGPTGSGKSTLTKLLLGLYDNYSGSITLNGQELSTLNIQSVRQHIATVGQDPRLFNRSVAFNISLGNPEITDEDIYAALELANAMSIIKQLPHGIHTSIQQFGQRLSAGEAQLIGFARALASKAPLILLDEATANIDSMSEQAIQTATNALLKDRTVLVIAHRLSTIQHADRIITLQNGQIIEKGSHDQLMANQGFYAKLFAMQQ